MPKLKAIYLLCVVGILSAGCSSKRINLLQKELAKSNEDKQVLEERVRDLAKRLNKAQHEADNITIGKLKDDLKACQEEKDACYEFHKLWAKNKKAVEENAKRNPK